MDKGRIGYIREALGGRIGRIYPRGEVRPGGDKGEGEAGGQRGER